MLLHGWFNLKLSWEEILWNLMDKRSFMNERRNRLEELEDFLGGTFHQDIYPPEQALDEFINEVMKEDLLLTIKDCEAFLNHSLTTKEKEDFIQAHTEIYFPALELTPIQGL